MIVAVILYVILMFCTSILYIFITPTIWTFFNTLANTFTGEDSGQVTFLITVGCTGVYSLAFVIPVLLLTFWVFFKSQEREVVFDRRYFYG